MHFFAIILILIHYQISTGLQYRKQCLPDSIDRRYEVCSCAKHLNLNCEYRSDINEIPNDKQDPAVRSIKLSMNENESTRRVYFLIENLYWFFLF